MFLIDFLLLTVWVYGVYLQTHDKITGLWISIVMSVVFGLYQMIFATHIFMMYVIAFGVLFTAGLIFSAIKQSERKVTLMNEPKTYVVKVDAMFYGGSTVDAYAVYQWIEQNTLGSFEPMAVIEGRVPCPESGVSIDPRDGRMMIATPNGLRFVDFDRWVVRGTDGVFKSVSHDEFADTYKEL